MVSLAVRLAGSGTCTARAGTRPLSRPTLGPVPESGHARPASRSAGPHGDGPRPVRQRTDLGCARGDPAHR